MARKPKKKVARKKVVSQPRKIGSRPVWALLFFTLAALVFVAVFDYNSGQYHADPPTDTNLVGQFGSFLGFHGFHYFGVSIWLFPLYLLWMGVRFLIQQDPRKRLITGLVALGSLICASGLAAMMGDVGQAQGGVFENQLSNGFGGVIGELIAPVILQPFIGPFGSFLILLMGFVVGSVIVFTDNLGRFLDYIQNVYNGFLAERAASKEERSALRAERGEAKRLAKEEVAAAKAQYKADRAAATKRTKRTLRMTTAVARHCCPLR